MTKLDNTPTGRLILTVFFAFAEFERCTLVETTQAEKKLLEPKMDLKKAGLIRIQIIKLAMLYFY